MDFAIFFAKCIAQKASRFNPEVGDCHKIRRWDSIWPEGNSINKGSIQSKPSYNKNDIQNLETYTLSFRSNQSK